jgi:hypothetical protein
MCVVCVAEWGLSISIYYIWGGVCVCVCVCGSLLAHHVSARYHVLCTHLPFPFPTPPRPSTNAAWQYLVLACDPYENIGFKIPNAPIDRREDRIVSTYDVGTGKFCLRFFYE